MRYRQLGKLFIKILDNLGCSPRHTHVFSLSLKRSSLQNTTRFLPESVYILVRGDTRDKKFFVYIIPKKKQWYTDYSDNQKTMEYEDDIIAILKCFLLLFQIKYRASHIILDYPQVSTPK